MRPYRLKKRFIHLLLPLIIISCSKALQMKPLSTENITIRQIREKVNQNFIKLSTIKGKARIIAEMPGMGFTALSQMVLKMPDQLKIEIKAGFGMGVGSIRLDSDKFIVYSAMENRVYYGNRDSSNISRFFQINLDFKELLDILTGSPLFSDADNTELTIDDDKYLIIVPAEDHVKKYWIDPKKYVITDFHIYDKNDALTLKHELRTFRKSHDIYLPKLIRVTHPQGNERVTIMFEERKINEKLDNDDFFIKIPESAERVKL